MVKELEGQFVIGVVDKPLGSGYCQMFALGNDRIDDIMIAAATGIGTFLIDAVKNDADMKETLAAVLVGTLTRVLDIDIDSTDIFEKEDLLNGKE